MNERKRKRLELREELGITLDIYPFDYDDPDAVVDCGNRPMIVGRNDQGAFVFFEDESTPKDPDFKKRRLPMVEAAGWVVVKRRKPPPSPMSRTPCVFCETPVKKGDDGIVGWAREDTNKNLTTCPGTGFPQYAPECVAMHWDRLYGKAADTKTVYCPSNFVNCSFYGAMEVHAEEQSVTFVW